MPRTRAVPDTAEALREHVLDPQNFEAIMESPQTFVEFVDRYVDASLSRDPDILAQNTEQFQNFMIEWLRDNEVSAIRALNFDPNSRRPVPKNTLYNPDAMGAKFDKDFTSATDFLYSISEHSFKDRDLATKLSGLKNAMSSMAGSDGGFLIPEVLRAELLQVALETSVVRSRARVVPMDSLTVPFPMVDSTSNASSVYGGITGYWTEEGATLTESAPKFGRVVLNAHKLTLYTEVPSELIQDSRPSMTALIDQMFPEAMAWFEDVAFFIGGGVGEPLGFLNAAATVSVDRTGSSSGTVVWADVVAMYSRMLPQSLNRAVWIVSPDVFPALATMTVGNVPVWIGNSPSGGGAASPWGTMLGRPLIISEKAKALGTAGDINFVDFGFYLVGDRQAMSARQSEDYRFKNDVTAFRVIERLDGRPWLNSAITPQNGSTNTLSPFVSLTTI
jgi:HK97 family phage major capsid protein